MPQYVLFRLALGSLSAVILLSIGVFKMHYSENLVLEDQII